ncbi:MAG: S-layer homology domain-containing protein [Oscillospiraceae bacterium]|nr:S-layer homology domain-containing protein [Oscillospiraceae bacterium]
MKSIKKILWLIIALAMALETVTLVSANSFTDSDKINYEEAVNVLTGIGVLDGFPDGSFKPLDDVTRAQAATILTRLLLGRKAADALPGDATGFPDVDGVSGVGFATKYIKYCAAQDIVVGYPDGNFGPNDLVTATQFAVMLMRALKIGNAGQYTGADWETYATLYAMQYNILDTDVVYRNPANREETAKYAFNGLLYSPDGRTTGASQDAAAMIPLDSVAAKVYPSLVKDNDGGDDLGRPGLVWRYGTPSGIIHRDPVQPVATFNSDFSQDDLYKVVGEYTTIPVKINATSGQTSSHLTSRKDISTSAASSIYTPNGGYGIITEIYKVGNSYRAIVIKPGFNRVYTADAIETSLQGAFTTYTVGGQSGKVYRSTVDVDTDKDTAIVIGSVAKDDYVLYYRGTDNLYIEAPRTRTGVVSSVSINSSGNVGSTCVIDGVKTGIASAFVAIGGLEIETGNNTQTFYTDSFGNILGIKVSAALPVQLALIIGFGAENAQSGGGVEYTARIVDTNGAASTVPTTVAIYGESGRDAKYLGTVCSYTISANGQYVFTSPAQSSPGNYFVDSGIASITNRSADLKGGSAVKLANSATAFVTVDYSSGSGRPYSPNGHVTVYKGIGQVPSLPLLTRTTAVSIKTSSSAPDDIAEIVYIYDDVFGAARESYAFVLGTWTQDASGYKADVIVKGMFASVRAKDETELAKLTGLAGSLLKSVSVAPDGVVTPGVLLDAQNSDAAVSIHNNGGLLLLDGVYSNMSVADDVPVYTITVPVSSPKDATVTTGASIDLKTELSLEPGSHVHIYEYSASVVAIYIVVYE